MAEKGDKTAAVLPLSMEGKKNKMKQKQALFHAALELQLLPSITDVIQWTLVHAGIVTFSFAFSTAYFMVVITISSHPETSWLLPRPVEMTGAEVAVALALWAGTLWCAAPQAAAGVLALMLPSHRGRLRLLLAYAGFVATAAEHCMFAGLHRMFVAAEPGGRLSFRTGVIAVSLVIVAVVDILYFLGLVLRGGEEE